MQQVILVHRSGPDRDAVTSFLEKSNFQVVQCETGVPDRSVSPDAVWVVEAPLVGTPAFGEVRAGRIVVLGGKSRASLPEGALVLGEPFFLPDLVKGIEAAVAAPRTVLFPRAEIPLPTDLLRSLTHALANPLSGAQGWLQLLAADLAAGDPRSRALRQARQDLLRLERMLQLFSWIGGRECAQAVPIDLCALIKDRVRPVQAEGLAIELDAPSFPVLFQGDPTPLQMVLDALLHSYLEERTRALKLELRLEFSAGDLRIHFSDEGGTVPADLACDDLPSLLKRTRTLRALGIALAHRLTTAYPPSCIAVRKDELPGRGGRIEWTIAPVQVGAHRLQGTAG